MLLKNYGLAVLDVPFQRYVVAGLLSGFPTAALWALVGSASQNLGDIVEGRISETNSIQ